MANIDLAVPVAVLRCDGNSTNTDCEVHDV